MFKLFKIVIDNPGVCGDGSDAQEHCELIYEGDELGLRETMYMHKLFTTKSQMKNIPVECLSYFASRKGYILSSIPVSTDEPLTNSEDDK